MRNDNFLKIFCSINGFVNTITNGTRTNSKTKSLTLLDVKLCKCNQFVISSTAFTHYGLPGTKYCTTYVADFKEKLRANVKDKLREAEIVHFTSDLKTLNDN